MCLSRYKKKLILDAAYKGSFINGVTLRWGEWRVHIIVTMCNVGERGEKYCDVTHVTFMARLSEGVRDNSTWRYTAIESYSSIIIRTPRAWYTTVNSASNQEWYLLSSPLQWLELSSDQLDAGGCFHRDRKSRLHNNNECIDSFTWTLPRHSIRCHDKGWLRNLCLFGIAIQECSRL